MKLGTTETAYLNPVELAPDRIELSLEELGIRIKDVDWGDSDVELFLIRQELGEIPADRHPPNQTITMKLKVMQESSVSLAEAAQRLQMALGRIQEEGGFIKRVFDVRGGFARSVAYQVHKVAFGGLQGWYMAHRQTAPEVTLTFMRAPYCYGLTEIQSATFEALTGRALVYKLNNVLGTTRGLLRVKITNKGAVRWLGLIHAAESRTYSAAATAEPVYKAEKLTPLGEAKKETELVKSGPLSGNFKEILGSKIEGAKHMTHLGPRRMMMRMFDPNTSIGIVSFQLEWRILGTTAWQTNDILSTPLVGGYCLVDLGECRPEAALRGEQRWEWRLLAKATENNVEIYVDEVYIQPTEQWMKMWESPQQAAGGKIFWEDHFNTAATGAATGKAIPIGGVYEGAGSANDFTYNKTNEVCERAFNKDSSLINGRFLFASTSKAAFTTLSGVIQLANNVAQGGRHGVLFRYVNSTNWARAVVTRVIWSTPGPIVWEGGRVLIEKCVGGVLTTLYTGEHKTSLKYGAGLKVIAETTGLIKVSWGPFSFEEATLEDIDFAAGHTLAEGKVGFYDCMPGEAAGSTAIRTYSMALAQAVASTSEEGAIAFPNRGLELRTDGVIRQHLTDEVWGKVVPDGFLPYAAPSGLEGLPMRGVIIPTQGDFDSVPDLGTNPEAVQVNYFPGYHFASEST